MTDRPILFSAPMVKALLDDRKTQTRRLAFAGAAEGPPTAWWNLYQDWLFRPIESYPDYLAGRDGLVYSLKRGEPTPLCGSPTTRGYLSVSLCRSGEIATHNVHVVIATAWLGPRPTPEHEVRHLDGNQTNNRISNLDWGTKTDNWSDRRALGRGILEEHHAAKLTLADAETIRQSTLPQRKLAKEYGVAQSTIWAIKKGELWRPAPAASGRNFALPPAPRLWVRETFSGHHGYEGVGWPPRSWQVGDPIWYWADGNPSEGDWTKPKPGIHMPRWASRLTLTVTDVRIQRLQEISEADAIAEGATARPRCSGFLDVDAGWSMDWSLVGQPSKWATDGKTLRERDVSLADARCAFWNFFNRINGPGSWEANPFVVAVSFSVTKANIDAARAA